MSGVSFIQRKEGTLFSNVRICFTFKGTEPRSISKFQSTSLKTSAIQKKQLRSNTFKCFAWRIKANVDFYSPTLSHWEKKPKTSPSVHAKNSTIAAMIPLRAGNNSRLFRTIVAKEPWEAQGRKGSTHWEKKKPLVGLRWACVWGLWNIVHQTKSRDVQWYLLGVDLKNKTASKWFKVNKKTLQSGIFAVTFVEAKAVFICMY